MTSVGSMKLTYEVVQVAGKPPSGTRCEAKKVVEKYGDGGVLYSQRNDAHGE